MPRRTRNSNIPSNNGHGGATNGHHAQGRSCRRRTRSTGFQQEDEMSTDAKDHFFDIGRALNGFRLSAKFTDIELQVEGRRFPAHKLILCSISPYFEAMFSSRLKEADDSSVELQGITGHIFEQLLDYVYTGELDICEENVQELLSAANMLQVGSMLDRCCAYLEQQLAATNAIGIFRFAEIHNCTLLKLTGKRYIERHFLDVVKSAEFLDISLSTLKSFLRSEGLSVYNEFEVFQATMDWILNDPLARGESTEELMDIVRLPLISQQHLDAFIASTKDERVVESLKRVLCKDRIQGSEQTATNVSTLRWQPRMRCRKNIYVIGGLYVKGAWENRTMDTIEMFDTFTNRWSSLPPMKHERHNHAVASLGGQIFVAGGESDSQIYNNVECFDLTTRTWSYRAMMRKFRSCFGMCAFEGQLYAFGGMIGEMADYSIERFNPISNTWSLDGDLKYCSFSMGVVVHQGYIYIMGGYDGHRMASKKVFRYRPGDNELKELMPMRQTRAAFGVAVLHDSIYVVGGSYGSSDSITPIKTSERYDIEENKWTKIMDMKLARASPSLVAVDNHLMVIGGRVVDYQYDSIGTTENAEIYEPEHNQWREGYSMIKSRSDAGVLVV